MTAGLRILITNNTLEGMAGTEMYVLDLARALIRRGHSPIAFSTELGDVAGELRKATVPAIDDLGALGAPPDVIHGQHHLDAMCAMLRFPEVPALYVCHGWLPWAELPPLFPSIVRYVAVDDLCRERLETTAGIAPDQIRTIYNSVDLKRFTPRPPLPARPRTALIFSNNAAEDNIVGTIRAACAAFGIDRVDVAGFGSGHYVRGPEAILGQYDVVFAKARCALEAMAVGCAVIVADVAGLGGLVTPENVERLRRFNFGIRTLQAEAVTVETVLAQLAAYDPQQSRDVSRWIREHADAEDALDRLASLYAEIAGLRVVWSAASAAVSCTAASGYLTQLARTTKHLADPTIAALRESRDLVTKENGRLIGENEMLRQETARLVRENEVLRPETERLVGENDMLRREAVRLGGENGMLQREVERLGAERTGLIRHRDDITHRLHETDDELRLVRSSRTWRAFSSYRSFRGWLTALVHRSPAA